MKLYRYMSYFEFAGLARGGILRNTTDHRIKRGSATTARGFCFGIGDEAQAKKDIRRLRGYCQYRDSACLYTQRHQEVHAL